MTEIQSDLGKQGKEISSVASKLASLETRVNEVLASLEEELLDNDQSDDE